MVEDTDRGGIDRDGLDAEFWIKKSLGEMSAKEWEALCDGCGQCCLNKLEDETGHVALTCVSCKLLDGETGLCKHYGTRHKYVPECIQLTQDKIEQHMYWLPKTCAYRLLYNGQDLPEWHPLKTGTSVSVVEAGASVIGRVISEDETDEDEWENYIIEEPDA